MSQFCSQFIDQYPFCERRVSFIKGKSDCKVIIFTAWGLGKSPGGLLGGTTQKCFGFSMSFKAIKRLTMTFKKKYIHGLRDYISS